MEQSLLHDHLLMHEFLAIFTSITGLLSCFASPTTNEKQYKPEGQIFHFISHRGVTQKYVNATSLQRELGTD